MGTGLQVNRGAQHTEPVDATSMHEWEADPASRAGAAVLFWCWYLPVDMLQPKFTAVIRGLARGRAALRYPLYTVRHAGGATRDPMRSR